MIFIFIARQLHAVRTAGAARIQRHGAVLDRLGRRAAGVLLKMFWPSAPRWVGVPLYLLLGWVRGVVHRADHGRRRRRSGGAADRRWRARTARRRGVLRAEVAQPVADDASAITSSSIACTAVAALCHYIAMWFAVF